MTMRVALIDYGAGNLRSAAKALECAANQINLSATISLVTDAAHVKSADYIVLPGVGSFEHCMTNLKALPDMVATLEDSVLKNGRPFLGICVGMQLLAAEGHEHGITEGLGWMTGTVKKLEPKNSRLKVPHMGWNTLTLTDAGAAHPVFRNIATGDHVYFVHSFHMADAHMNMAARAFYGIPVTAAVIKDTVVGVQFHPEKSQAVGLKLLGDFLRWRP